MSFYLWFSPDFMPFQAGAPPPPGAGSSETSFLVGGAAFRPCYTARAMDRSAREPPPSQCS
jgi:hypothetical protein